MAKQQEAGNDPFKLPPKAPPRMRTYGGAYSRECEDISREDDQKTQKKYWKIRARQEEKREAKGEEDRRAVERRQETGRKSGVEIRSPRGKLKDKLRGAVEDSKTGAKLAKNSAKYVYENSMLAVEETGIKVKNSVQKGVVEMGRKLSKGDVSPGMADNVAGFDMEFSASPRTDARPESPGPVPARKLSLPEVLWREAKRFKEALVDLPHQGIYYHLNNNNQKPRANQRSLSQGELPRARTHESLPSDQMTGETLSMPGQDVTSSRKIGYGEFHRQIGESTGRARPEPGSSSPIARYHPTPSPDIGYGRVYYHYGERETRARARPHINRDDPAPSSSTGLIDRLGNSFAIVRPETGSLGPDPYNSTEDLIQSLPDFSTPPPSPPPPSLNSRLSDCSISSADPFLSKPDLSETIPDPSSPPPTPSTPLSRLLIPYRYNRLVRLFRSDDTSCATATDNLPIGQDGPLQREDSLKRTREPSGSGPSSAKPPSKRHEGDDRC
ncbi:MAG: hypothetical protein Q9187_006817 [Circinaria calcarea]